MAEPDKSISLSSIISAFTRDYILGLIDHVLQFREEASGGVLKELNSAINQSIKIRGFRYSSKAQLSQLKERMLGEVDSGNDRLTGEVFRAWVESQKELQALVERHLRSRDVPVDGPNRREGVFKAYWRMNEWKDVVDTISLHDSDVDRDDVRMMVCYVSGMAERLDVTSPLLSDCINQLRELSVENPDWQDIDDFVGIVNEIANSKAERRTAVFAERCRDTLQQAQCDFVTELEYLQLDIVAWAQEASEKPAAITTALKLAEDLKYNLEEYQDVRPQAESRKEEAERAPARAERESVILRIVDAWRCIFDAKDDRNGDGTIPSVANALDDGSAPAGEQAGGTTAPEEYQDLLSACESLKRERESFRSENDRLQTENNRLAQENAGVEAVKQSLDSEPRTKPLQSRDLGEYWQRFYAASEQLGCVNDAVLRAMELFPKQLVFALNSKSDKDSPFQKPAEAFAALVWLATDYHHLRWTKPGTDPRFEERLKKSCSGWSYKPHQANVTKQQFAEWYTTKFEGRRYELNEHLGKGTSADPQNTIRIAFAWDEDCSQVIVGYIGQHQKNRRS